ncbi:MAG: hypothetical protein IJA23_04185, partial [Clostridia bacterium]|nr:hypothetical protein [Clostridia bacterium]
YKYILDGGCSYVRVNADKSINPDYHVYLADQFIHYDNILLYQQYQHDYFDLIPDTNTTPEALGDRETVSQHFVVLVANWLKKEYEVDFVMMDASNNDGLGANGSTNAYFVEGNNYITVEDYDTKLYTMFDTVGWYTKVGDTIVKDSDGNIVNHIESIMADRFGYSFIGWTAVPYIRNEFSDDIAESMVVYNRFTDYTVVLNENVYESAFKIIDNEEEGIARITIYAWWRANEYEIVFEYNDVETTEYTTTQSTDIVPNLSEIKGTSKVVTRYETVTVTFDSEITIDNITRNGYHFAGFAINNTLDNSQVFNANTATGKTTIVLNRETAMIKDDTDSLDTESGYLYEAGTREVLGDIGVSSEGDVASTIKLFALWTPITYKNVTINMNDSILSPGYYYSNSAGEYIDTNISIVLTLQITFDTNEWTWKFNDNSGTGTLDEIKIGRFGYTFKGWYTTAACENSIYVNDPENPGELSVLNDTLYQTFDEADRSDTLGYESLTIYAGWTANTYDVKISDVDGADPDITSPIFYRKKDVNEFNLKDLLFTEGDIFKDYYELSIVFDTTAWTNLNKVVIDRYGFTWTGFYVTPDSAAEQILYKSENAEENTMFDINLFKAINKVNKPAIDMLNEYGDVRTITIAPHWDSNVYNVELSFYDKDNGFGSSYTTNEAAITYDSTIKLGDKFDIVGIPNRKGYTFVGWIVGTYSNSFNDNELLVLGHTDFNYIINYNYLHTVDENTVHLYQRITPESVTTERERLGDVETTDIRYIYIYAYTVANKYTIIFNANDSNSTNGMGSTNALFYDVNNTENPTYSVNVNTYTLSDGLPEFNITETYITFDTDLWNRAIEIGIERFGYIYSGWYNSPASGQTLLPENLVFKSSGIELNNTTYDTLEVDETNKTINIYAGWKAKKYYIQLEYGLVPSFDTSHPFESVFDYDSDLSKYYFVFDKEYTAPFLKDNKHSHDFVGWSFAQYETYFDDSRPNTSGSVKSPLAFVVVPSNSGRSFKFGYYAYNDKDTSVEQTYDNTGKNLIYGEYTMADKSVIDTHYLWTEGTYAEDCFEKIEDVNEIGYIKLYAVWKPKTFTIVFDLNAYDPSNP